jgi:sugar O-acyltransferase (sialic acid O-acetyltransferase NeuD family)
MTSQPEQIVVVGAGGHGREAADIVRASIVAGRSAVLAGYVDDAHPPGTRMGDLCVLGDLRWLVENSVQYRAVVAFGHPQTCHRVATGLGEVGVSFTSAIHPTATISGSATLGDGVILFPNVVVNTGAIIGAHVTLNVGASVSHDTRVGEFSNLNPGSRIAGNVVIGRGAYVGMGASILQRLFVGDWVVIGAGAVVIRNLASHVTAVGVPARTIKQLPSPPQQP